jgi:hypothetical protein
MGGDEEDEKSGISKEVLDRLEREKKEAVAKAEELLRAKLQVEMKEQEVRVREKFIADVEARRKEMEVEVTKRGEKERETLRLQFELDLRKREDSMRAVMEQEYAKRLEKEKDSARMVLELEYKRREDQVRDGLESDFNRRVEILKRELGGPLAGVRAVPVPKEPFPFSAVLGMDRAKRAMTLAAVNPDLGGVLIWGHAGDMKHHAVLGLAAMIGEFKHLDGTAAKPYGAEDRFVRVMLPGLNTFISGLIDTELRVACLDYSRTDRREGDLHLSVEQVEPRHLNVLEAFHSLAMQIEILPPEKADDRVEIVRRVKESSSDPVRFRKAFEKDEKELREKVLKARERLPKVAVPSKLGVKIAQMCYGQPMRTDIVLNELARAKAALEGREGVTTEDVQEAADISLAHRVGQDIFKLLKE